MTYEDVKNAPVVLMEFYATWCGHCVRMAPVVDQVRELLDGQAPVVQVDIDKNKELAEEFEIDSTPTFIIFKNGEPVWRHSGEMDGNMLLSKVQSYL